MRELNEEELEMRELSEEELEMVSGGIIPAVVVVGTIAFWLLG